MSYTELPQGKADPTESLESLAWSIAGLPLAGSVPLEMPSLLTGTGLPGHRTRQTG